MPSQGKECYDASMNAILRLLLTLSTAVRITSYTNVSAAFQGASKCLMKFI